MATLTHEEFADYLQETYTVRKRNYRNLSFDGRPLTKTGVMDLLDPARLLREEALPEYVLMTPTERKRAVFAAYDLIMHRLNEAKETLRLGDRKEAYRSSTEGLILASWLRTGDRFVFDTSTNRVSIIDAKAYLGSLPKEEQIQQTERIPFMDRVYDPYDISGIRDTTVSNVPVQAINAYIPPTWRLDETQHEDCMPLIFSSFFNHLFPDPKVQEFVFNWIRTAILERNETILTINGVKGIGKGVFSEMLKALVGKENYEVGAVNALDSTFNAVLKDNRVIVFDEIEVNKSAHSKLKRYTNRDQSIEAKGVDATRAMETYNSFLITNNDTSDMYIEVDDRRFSVIECTTKPLLNAVGKESVDEIIVSLEDEKLVGQLGTWFIKHGACGKYNSFSVWKGPTFYKLAYTSLAAWQKHIVDLCTNAVDDSPLFYASMKKAFKKDTNGNMPSNMSKVDDFLKNYLHLGEFPVATLRREEGVYTIEPTLEIIGKGVFEATTPEMIAAL